MIKIEIWSDVVCPFCYIGKRRLEKALTQFENKDKVRIIWRSYQLDPSYRHVEGTSIHKMLADKKGISVDEAKSLNDQLTEMAKQLGLTYNFDIAVPSNTLNAHRLAHLALENNLQEEMEERLFRAYFCEGKNVNDIAVLKDLGTEVGIPEKQLNELFNTDKYIEKVKEDVEEGLGLGVRGVPFFVFNRKFAVSGAQSVETFLSALQKADADNVG